MGPVQTSSATANDRQIAENENAQQWQQWQQQQQQQQQVQRARAVPAQCVTVSLAPGMAQGLIQSGREVRAVTHDAPQEIAETIRPGDVLVEIDGQDVREIDQDYLKAILVSLPEGSDGYSLKFERPSNSAAGQELAGPDFFDDQDATGGVEWFSFWDLDHDDRLGLEETAHALDRSFGLERVQYNRMRGLL